MAGGSVLYNFGSNGNAARHLAGGWSAAEGNATWTDGTRAELTLPRLAADDYSMQIAYRTFVAPARAFQRVAVRLGNTVIGQFIATTAGEITLWLPEACLRAAPDPMVIAFDLPDAARPADWRPGEDTRMLGLAIRHIDFKPLPPKMDPALIPAARAAESIGRNCEFAFLQRRCGVEPISLLRWSGAPTSGLIEALENRFEGLLEDATGIGVPRGAAPEQQKWWLTCSRYHIVFHTPECPATVTMEEAVVSVRRRARWQAEKQMDDLRLGEKMFVYSSAEFASAADAAPLVRALRDCGAAGKLVIVGSGADEAMREVDRNTWFARLPKLTAMTDALNADFRGWMRILAEMGRLSER